MFNKLIKLIIKDKLLFALLVISTAFIAFICCFSYGMIINQRIDKSVLNNESENRDVLGDYYIVNMHFDSGKVVTKADLKRCFEKIIDSYEDIVENTLDCVFVLTKEIDWGYDMKTPMEILFTLDGDGYHISKNRFSKNYGGFRGEGWTDEDEEDGNRVAVFWDYKKQESPSDDYPDVRSALNPDGTVTIEGNKYQIVGYYGPDYYPTPWVPFNSLADSTEFDVCHLYFNEFVTENTFNYVKKIFSEELGDRVKFVNEDKTKRKINYTYNTAYIAAALLAFVMLVNYLILYTYVFEKLKNGIASFRICGASAKKVLAAWIEECIVISLPVFVMTMLIFHFVIRPWLKPYLKYLGNIFTFRVYFMFASGYLLLLALLCVFCFWKRINKIEIIRKEVA